MRSASLPALRAVDLGDLSPAEVAGRLRHLPGLVFFDSALEGTQGTRVSIVSARPAEDLRGSWDRDWTGVQAAVRARMATVADDGLPRGFVAGWIGYDGEYRLGVYEEALFYRHADATWWALGELAAELRVAPKAPGHPPLHFIPEMEKDDFCQRVRRAQDYIAAGDIYQVNLSHRFSARWGGDPWALYEALRTVSPAPHAAFLDLDSCRVVSASPELFLRMSGDSIVTRPIKGTRPRGTSLAEDEQMARDLAASPKEAAELVMITDLERNDLGQVCQWGSVEVRELLALERFPQIFHLVSTVAGRLRAGVDHVTALHACFPGGSITGAPKRRAREIIAELEPTPRGLYTGAIGYWGFNGESQFSIAIRTVVVERGEAHFHVGAGIVADSVPEREWEETLHKAAGILRAANNP